MKLFLKISLSIFALILIAILALFVTFNPNDYKAEIIDLIQEKTGRELSIPGKISLSFFPWIGLELGAIELGNAKGFTPHAFAKMTHLQVRAKLLPLFKQRLEADTIVIEGLTLNLTKNKKGLSNWEDLAGNTAPTKSTTSNNTNKTSQANAQNILAAFALNGITIKDAQINWLDMQNNQQLTLKNIQLSSGKLRAQSKIPLKLQFHIQDKLLAAQVKFGSQVVFSSDFKQFSFHDTTLSSDLKLTALKNPVSPKLSSALIKLDLNKQSLSTEDVTLSEGSINLHTSASVSHILTSPGIISQITLDAFNPRELAEKFSITLPGMSDKKALTQLSAKIDVVGSLDKIDLSKILLTLDETHLTGNATVLPATGSSTFNLALDNINLDRYLAKPILNDSNKSEQESASEAIKGAEAALIPVALLSLINTDGDIRIKQFQIKNTHWTDFHVQAHSKEGLIQLAPFTLHGYESNISSNVKLKINNNNALLSGNLDIQNIEAGKLFNDFSGKDKLKGKVSLNTNFNTSGVQLSQLKKHLNGTLKFNLLNGTIKGFNLDHQQQVLEAKIKGQAAPATPAINETKIANLNASAIIDQGVLTNKDLRAATPLARVAGQGTVNLNNEQINYLAAVKFTSSTNITTSTSFENMNSIPLDVHISGTFDDLHFKVDFEKILRQALAKELKKQEQKVKAELQEKLKLEEKKLKDKIKSDLEKQLGKKLDDEKSKEDAKKQLENKLGDELKKRFKF
jgi:AsmA protein